MKHIDNLMPLATLEDLRGFCLDYTRRDKKFGNELAKFLKERFIDDEDSAADFIARLEDAFGEEKNFSFYGFVILANRRAMTAPLMLCHTLKTAPGMVAIG